MSRTKQERERTADEVKFNVYSNQIEDCIASRCLFKILEDYVDKGTAYVDKHLTLDVKTVDQKYYLINLYNDKNKKDTVLIRTRQE